MKRREAITTIGLSGMATVAGCLSSSPDKVDGFTHKQRGEHSIHLGENEYSTLEYEMNRTSLVSIQFEVSSGNLSVLSLVRREYEDNYQSEGRLIGNWETTSEDIGTTRYTNGRFDAGELVMIVADNTGYLSEHEVNGPVRGRIDVRAEPMPFM